MQTGPLEAIRAEGGLPSVAAPGTGGQPAAGASAGTEGGSAATVAISEQARRMALIPAQVPDPASIPRPERPPVEELVRPEQTAAASPQVEAAEVSSEDSGVQNARPASAEEAPAQATPAPQSEEEVPSAQTDADLPGVSVAGQSEDELGVTGDPGRAA